jgi:hypothetical protein
MNSTATLFSRESILSALDKTHGEVSTFFGSQHPEGFHQRAAGAWSLAENLEHLIRSVKPVATAMRLPKVTLRLMFGTPPEPSRSFEQIKQAYVQELAKGAQASGRFLPTQPGKDPHLTTKQADLLKQWEKTSSGLISALQNWDEDELDLYNLPHPILGNLTIREMLFFTIYHDMRHMTPEGD